MKHLGILITFLSISQILYAQDDYQSRFVESRRTQDTTAQRLVLEEWQKSEPNNPDLYASYFTYYFFLSQQNMLSMDSKPGKEESLQILDSTDQVMAFLVDRTFYNPDLLSKGFESVNTGIRNYPSRLDMRFGKAYAFGQIEDWEGFTKEIVDAVEYSQEISNKWTWTNNKAVDDPENFFLGSIQGYQGQLFNTESDLLLSNMREIAEKILEYYPEHVESLSNISASYLITGEYDKALVPLLKAEKIDPTDAIVLGNIAYAYKLKGDTQNSIKYYEKTIEHGDEAIKQMAEQQIDNLKK